MDLFYKVDEDGCLFQEWPDNATATELKTLAKNGDPGVLVMTDRTKEITIPAATVTIPGDTFKDCTSLTSVTVPDTVAQIGFQAFKNCTNLQSINLPANAYLDPWVFQGCSSLKNITIPSGCKIIERFAFKGCTSLTNVTISEGVTEILQFPFDGCENLQSVTVPASVTTIHKGAFALGLFKKAPKNLKIVTPANSEADKYARKNNIPVINI